MITCVTSPQLRRNLICASYITSTILTQISACIITHISVTQGSPNIRVKFVKHINNHSLSQTSFTHSLLSDSDLLEICRQGTPAVGEPTLEHPRAWPHHVGGDQRGTLGVLRLVACGSHPPGVDYWRLLLRRSAAVPCRHLPASRVRLKSD